MNQHFSGFATGFNRLEAETEPRHDLVTMIAEGILNELLIIRKFRVGNQPDYLLFFTTFLQLAAVVFIVIKLKGHYHLREQFKRNTFTLTCFVVALLYLAVVIILRSLSHFDDLDYRLLSPFSFLFWIGILNTLVVLPGDIKGAVEAKSAAFAFFIISLLLNLPKLYILEKVMQQLP
ncbi:hypothetical protein GCM10027443_41000 [Pontibacter brevis]